MAKRNITYIKIDTPEIVALDYLINMLEAQRRYSSFVPKLNAIREHINGYQELINNFINLSKHIGNILEIVHQAACSSSSLKEADTTFNALSEMGTTLDQLFKIERNLLYSPIEKVQDLGLVFKRC